MVERRYRRHDPDRLLGGESPSVRAGRSQPHGDFLAAEIAQFVCRVHQAVDPARYLDDCVGQRFAAFAGDHHRKAVAVLLQKRRRLPEDCHPLMRGQPAVAIGKGLCGDLKLALERGCVVCLSSSAIGTRSNA